MYPAMIEPQIRLNARSSHEIPGTPRRATSAPIAPATRAKVLAAAQALGYQPNTVARSLITKRSGLVAILISQDTQRETSEVLFSLGLALQRHGFQPLLFTVAQESEAEQALARALAHLALQFVYLLVARIGHYL